MPTTPTPVASDARVASLDVIRGFALLGILAPNILAFGWVQSVFAEPDVFAMALEHSGGGEVHQAANELGIRIVHLFFHGKMMFLFSLLFGAGVLMYARKFDRGQVSHCARCGHDLAGSRPDPTQACPECGQPNPTRAPKLTTGAALWYQRCAWLLAIGLLHAFGLWYGDILVWYALAGLGLVWWVRRLRAPTQFALGAALYLLGVALLTGLMIMGLAFGESSGQGMLGDIPGEVNAYRGGYLDALQVRAFTLLFMYIILIPFGFFWISTGIMVTGMALTKTGVLTGERSDRFYAVLAGAGLSVGLGATGLTMALLARLDDPWGGFIFMAMGQLVGIPTSLGYAAVLILLVRRSVLRPVTGALAAVGRMALSNYLLHTILCTTLFYGYGLGYFARIQFPGLWLVVVGVWAINIVFSLLWLRVFRFGPAEWLWRSLTYLRPQPLLRSPADPPG